MAFEAWHGMMDKLVLSWVLGQECDDGCERPFLVCGDEKRRVGPSIFGSFFC